MGKDGSRSRARRQDEPVCPSCGRPVDTVIKRRKVLGAFVPVWGPGPCHNPQCEACVDEVAQQQEQQPPPADAAPARSDET
ncbi:hypothetical protein AB0O76_08390 [Streptomyces sp. NPDC086554]|uniref:hypothetical protein n=1 Tax=Streptomyces sp. NPDC086554 TaxID=3154864 RepID=UPI0034435956